MASSSPENPEPHALDAASTVDRPWCAGVPVRIVTAAIGELDPRRWARRTAGVARVAGAVVISSATVPLRVSGWLVDRVDDSVVALPEVEIVGDDRDGLFVHLVAAAVPAHLGSFWARVVVNHVPVELALGLASGGDTATVRVGRGAITVSGGLAPDVVAVLEGDLQPLLSAAGDVLARELLAVPAS